MVAVPQAFALALQHHQAGRLAEAEALYRRILAVQPHHPGALHLLGVVAHQAGHDDLAVEWIRQALLLDPNNPTAHSNLGEAFRTMGRLDESVASFHQALQLRPDSPQVHYNLGNALREQGHVGEAVAAYRRALALKPDYEEAHINLGVALTEHGQTEEAIAEYRRALALQPDDPEAHNNLGNALVGAKQLDEAVAACRRALELRPDYPDAHNNLGSALAHLGQLDEALIAFRHAVDLKPADATCLSNLIYAMHLSPACDARSIHEEQALWNRRYVEPLRASWRPHANVPDPLRRLKIGYVSPDFRSNSVAFFLTPLLEAHDHRLYEIYCYTSAGRPDAVTERLRKCADVWREVHTFSDARLAGCVREDGIDILVDLAMHTAGGRLPVFARQPAPVQVSWLAYAGSTGMAAIDYRLTDAHIDPVDQEEDGLGGQVVRLPDAWCCYLPIEEFPSVSPLPAALNGTVTFGSINQFGKLHEGLLHCWARLLGTVLASRLLMVCPEGQASERTHALFAAHGVARDRVELVAPCPWADYARLLGRIDLALDSYPYNGMTTTCHTLWMGVPVVTLAGTTAVSRSASSLLHAVGLPEWVAQSEEQYLRIATGLANDLPALAELRATLRPRMQASPLMDARRFARNVESAYRTIWQSWCTRHS